MTFIERIFDATTGETTERPYTAEETIALKEIAAQAEVDRIAAEAEAATKAVAKADLLAKLGISEDEAKLLLS